jgi:hypothetical protein
MALKLCCVFGGKLAYTFEAELISYSMKPCSVFLGKLYSF